MRRDRQRLDLDSEVIFGEAEFPQPGTVK